MSRMNWWATRPPALLVPMVVLLSLGSPTNLDGQSLELSSATIADWNVAFDAGTFTSEELVRRYLARIEAYDQHGPVLNAVLWLNPQAIETARALDAERLERGPRSPLHGIPVVLKDNIDTADMPTTAGSLLLAGSIPPKDAFIVQNLREAGAIILAKVNLSEFAVGPTMSSMGGQIRNPHDPERSPSGSSGGTGAAVAAWYAQGGMGTDTGGSIRGPATANGIVGLKPTLGLLSRSGIVPLGLTFDVPGPMARSVYDVAVMLGAMTGLDPADEATHRSEGRVPEDYTQFLDANALDGARIGVARDFVGGNPEVQWILEASLEAMRAAGATVVDVSFPQWLLDVKGSVYLAIRRREFGPQIEAYLATLGPEYPKTLEELIERSQRITSLTPDGGGPNPSRWRLFQQEAASGSLSDHEYTAMRDYGMPLVRSMIEGAMVAQELDAIVYPTSPGGGGPSPLDIASVTGFPDLIVPAGFDSSRMPVGISFLGPAFGEPRLLALGYAFEHATRVRRDPATTPPLPGETVPVAAVPHGGR